jgi:predicted nucleic acid-binding protein
MGDPNPTALLVVDTDVLIDYLRDQADAVAFLEGCAQPLALSVVSVAELYVGVREGVERERLDGFVSAFDSLPLERDAAVRAGLWRHQRGRGGCHPGHPQAPPFPDAGRCACALCQALTA